MRLLILVAALALPLAAARADGHDRALEALRAGEIAPLPEILDAVAARVPGSVIEVDLKRRHGRYVYEIEVLTAAGTVEKLLVDAKDKRILDRDWKDDRDEHDGK